MSNSSFDVGTVFCLGGKVYTVEAGGRRSRALRDHATQELVMRTVAQLRQAYMQKDLRLEDLFSTPEVSVVPGSEVIEKSLASYSQRDRNDVLVKLHFLNGICPRGRLSFRRAELRDEMVKLYHSLPEALHAQRPPGISTFYEWRRDWINSGFCARRLVNRYDLRGRRPRPTPPQLQPILERSIEEIYATGNRPSVSAALDNAEAHVNRQNLVRPPTDQLPLPTRRQITREIAKVDRYVLLERRYGKAHARTATRVFAKTPQPTRLLERVEIDHTPLDVICIADENGLVVGRPNATVIIDVASRMILGVWISFRPPNADTVLRALKHAILPKDDLLKKYGIKGEWPARGVPSVVFMDNGKEFHGNDVEGAALDLGFSIVYCPPRQPFFKGVIERFLQELNYRFIHLLPGTTFAKYYLREDYESLRHAVIPVEDLRRFVYRWVVEVYSKQFHRGLQTCALEKWKELELHGKPVLPRSAEVLDVFLTPTKDRNLSSKGIEVNSLHYISPELSDLRLLGGNQSLKVKPNPNDMGFIHVLHPETKTYFKAFCTWPDYANGLSQEQHDWFRKTARDTYAALPHRSALLAAKLEMQEEAAQMKAAHLERQMQSATPAKAKKPKTKRSGVETQCIAENAATAAASAREVDGDCAEHTDDRAVPVSFEGLTAFATGQSALF